MDFPIDFVVPVIQVDDGHYNALPVAFAAVLARHLGAKLWLDVCQINKVNHTEAHALDRLRNQPVFGGTAPNGRCLICDDVVTYGATLANLRGFLVSAGAEVAAATALGAAYGSTKLAPESSLIDNLRERYDRELERQTARLGFRCECLTAREAYFLDGLRTTERFRNCFAQEVGEANRSRGVRCRISGSLNLTSLSASSARNCNLYAVKPPAGRPRDDQQRHVQPLVDLLERGRSLTEDIQQNRNRSVRRAALRRLAVTLVRQCGRGYDMRRFFKRIKNSAASGCRIPADHSAATGGDAKQPRSDFSNTSGLAGRTPILLSVAGLKRGLCWSKPRDQRWSKRELQRQIDRAVFARATLSRDTKALVRLERRWGAVNRAWSQWSYDDALGGNVAPTRQKLTGLLPGERRTSRST